MSDSSSSSSLILPSSQDLEKAAAAENRKCKNKSKSSDSRDKENESDGKSSKSPSKIRRNAVSMIVDETDKELRYRRKHFGDVNEVVTNRKLRCTACCCSLQSVVLEGRDVFHHSVLKVLMCKTCIGFYGDGDISLDEDGSDKYCRWCGQGGTLYCCAKCCCAFCKSCIKRNLNRSILDDIESEDWECFVCNGEPLWELRAICSNAQSKREEYQRSLKQLSQKKTPVKQKSRRLNRWQKNSSSDSSSEDNATKHKSKKEQSKKKRKREKLSPSLSEEGKKDEKKQKIKGSNSDSDVKCTEIREKTIECVVLSDSDGGTVGGSARRQRSQYIKVEKTEHVGKISKGNKTENVKSKKRGSSESDESHSDKESSDEESKKKKKKQLRSDMGKKNNSQKNSKVESDGSSSDENSDNSRKKKGQKGKSKGVKSKKHNRKKSSESDEPLSDEETSEDEKKKKQIKKSKGKGSKNSNSKKSKMVTDESYSDEESCDDSRKEKVKHKENGKSKQEKSRKKVVKTSDTDESIVKSSTSKRKSKKKDKNDSSDNTVKESVAHEELPDEVDTKSAKMAYQFIEDHITELENLGQLLSYRAKRIREKKVNEVIMSKPEKVGEIVGNIKLLMKLASENMEHTEGYLSLHHKYWKKRVIRKRRSKKTTVSEDTGKKQTLKGRDNSDDAVDEQDEEKKNKKDVTNECDLDMDVSVSEVNAQNVTSDNGAASVVDTSDLNTKEGKSEVDYNAENANNDEEECETINISTSDAITDQMNIENDSDDRTTVDMLQVNGRQVGKNNGEMVETADAHDVDKTMEIETRNDSNKRKFDGGDAEEMNNETSIHNNNKDGKRRKLEDATHMIENNVEDSDETMLDNAEVPEQSVGKIDSEFKELTCPEKSEDSKQFKEEDALEDNENNKVVEESDKDSVVSESIVNLKDTNDKLSIGTETVVLNSDKDKESVVTVENAKEDEAGRNTEDSDSDRATIECVFDLSDDDDTRKKENDEDKEEDDVDPLANDLDSSGKGKQDDVDPLGNELDSSIRKEEERNPGKSTEAENNVTDVEDEIIDKDHKDDSLAINESINTTLDNFDINTSLDNSDINTTLEYSDPVNTILKERSKTKDDDSNDKESGKGEMAISEEVTEMDAVNDVEKCNNMSESGNSEDRNMDVEQTPVAPENEEEEKMDSTVKSDDEKQHDKDTSELTEECIKAQQALLGYTSDDEDEDDVPKKKKLRKKKECNKKSKENEVDKVTEENEKPKKRPGPKSRTCTGNESLSSSLSSETDSDSDCSTDRRQRKMDGRRKKKFKLKNIEAYKKDEKLGWKCEVILERLGDEEFQRLYETYYSDEEDELDRKVKDNKEIKSLVNLKSLKKLKGRKSDDSSADSDEDSKDNKGRTKKKSKKDKKKEQEQKLIDFFNRMDEDEKSVSSDASGSEKEVLKAMKMKKKNFLEKENEMAMKLLLGSSSDSNDNDSSGKEEESEDDKKKKKKKKVDDKTEDCENTVKKEEEEEEEKKEMEEEKEGEEKKEKEEKKENEEKKDKSEDDENDEKKKKVTDSAGSNDDKDSSDDSKKRKKKNWRRDKLLIEKLSDLDTSDEERLWKAKKDKEMKLEDNDSEEKSGCERTPRKKNVRRRILGSDDDSEVVISSSDSSSDAFITKKRKKTKKSGSDEDKSSDSGVQKNKKTKHKRIRAPASDSSSDDENCDDGPKSETPGKGRKKIHRILKDENVGEATRRAAKEEEERRKRIAEKQKWYNEIYKLIEGEEKVDKLILDFDPETKEELVSVDPYIVTKLKPHQVKGVKFMWDASFESVKRIQKSPGSGCILAHCMGLGKTFQVVTLVHTLLNNKKTNMKTVLVVCPLSTVLNWVGEFNMWLKDIGDGDEVNVFELSKYKQNYERMYQLKDWHESGGVMVLGYDMYRNLTNPQTKRIRKKAVETFQSTLVDPGPDLVVCDEGHLLKNEDTAIAKAMRRIRTLRRIVLTGTPLQNNLKEYHCMVQFVKPNLLGTRREFLNRFVNPITNGQFEDSTQHDVKIMKRRAHVLHKMLEGSVQRFDYSVLTPFLPPKYEYVISIRLSEIQVKAYRHYLENYSMGAEGGNKGAKLFTDFQNLQRIWTHPRVLQMSAERAEKTAERKRLMDSDSEGSLRDFIDDDDDGATSSTTTLSSTSSSNEDSDVQIVDNGKSKEDSKSKKSKYARCTRSKGLEEPEVVEDEKQNEEAEKNSPTLWWKRYIEGDELDNIKYSGKLVLLFSILRECEKIGDKVLVFSQSLFSLDLIEHFLGCIDNATQNGETSEALDNNTGSWALGLDYFRLDGSTPTENRNQWCKTFNRDDNHRARLFIISTRAGGLGINLYAANRVIIFDASWNPSHDVQSIFRVYRFGQKKPCYIYRFLAQGTMEEKIYDRQVTKLSLSCRVVDEQQIERHYNMADLQELYQFDPEQKTKRPTPILPKDRLLAELLKEQGQWIVTYHEHDSLLENKQEEELNEEERKAAWEEYENEKKGKVLPAVGQVPNNPLNIAALREALRNENPLATEEQLDQKLSIVLNQICDFMSAQQNGVASNLQYTAAQIQALQQYRLQQEQLMRMRLQQQAAASAAAGYPTADISFKQYMQDQKPMPQNALFPNMYRSTNLDKSGVLRMQSKLVPFTTPGSSGMGKYANLSGDHLVTRQPVMLPYTTHSKKRGNSILKQPPAAHASSTGPGISGSWGTNLNSNINLQRVRQQLSSGASSSKNSGKSTTSILQDFLTQQEDGGDKSNSVPDNMVIETID